MNSVGAVYLNNRKKFFWRILFIALLLPVFFLFDLSFGSVSIPFSETLSVLTGGTASKASWQFIILETRLPQAITAISAGAGLAVCGLLLQSFFRNPLAGPSVLGISSGSTFGIAILIMGSSWIGFDLQQHTGTFAMIIAAFLGAMLVLLLILLFTRISNEPVTVLIAGLMTGYLISALVNLLEQFSSKDQLQQFVFWGFGSFAGNDLYKAVLFLILTLVFISPLVLFIKPLNAWILGDAYARTMGIEPSKFRWKIILFTGLLTGTVTAFCGPIAFVGLAVPHLVRRMIRTEDHTLLIPAVALAGAILCSFCSMVSRLPFSDQTIPLNAITAIIGAPVVIWVIFRRKVNRGGWS